MESARDQQIVTTGEGRVQVTANEARLWIALSSRNPDRSLVVRRVSEESARLRAVLDKVGYDHLTTGGLTITAERKIERGVWYGLGRVVAYVVRQSFEISERRVDRVQELARLLAEWEPAAEVVVESWQVTWHLSTERHSAAVSDAAAIAYRDAQHRAAALAASAGINLRSVPPFVYEVSASQLNEFTSALYQPSSRFISRAYAAEEPTFPVTIEPPAVYVTASLRAGWQMQSGDQLGEA